MLEISLLAVSGSTHCLIRNMFRVYDLVHEWREDKTGTISGFHLLVEKEILEVFLRGTSPVFVCPVHVLEGMHVPSAWMEKIDAGQLMVLSLLLLPSSASTPQRF